MASVSKPSFRQREWITAKGVKKSAWELSFFIKDGDSRERILRSGYPTKKAADAAFRDITEKVINGKFGKMNVKIPTLKEFVEVFHKEGSAGKRPVSIQTDRLATKAFLEHVPGKTKLDKITTKQVDTFLANRMNEGLKESTVLRQYSTIRRMFNLAIRWEILTGNPAVGAKKPTLPEGDVVFLELHEQKALLSACTTADKDSKHNMSLDTPYMRPLVALALYTGLRRGELFNLRWQDIDFEYRKLTVRNTVYFQTKTKKNRTIELTEGAIKELKAWKAWFQRELARSMERAADMNLSKQLREKAEVRLETLRRCKSQPERLVFPSMKAVGSDGEALPMDNVRKALASAVKNAGIKRTVGLHALRHTFSVTLARRGVPLTKISKALGHTNLKTTQIYLRFSPDEGADVTRHLPDLSDVGRPEAGIVGPSISAL